MRTAFYLFLALVALAADALAAFALVRGLAESATTEAAPIAAAPFSFLPGWMPSTSEILLIHVAVVTLGTLFLSATVSSPTSRDATARWFLFLSLSLPLPGIGFAISYLAAIALTFTKSQRADESLFQIGNPLADPVTGSLTTPLPNGSKRPIDLLSSRIRGSDLTDLRSLAIGLRGLPIDRTAPVLERLQRDPDTYLQLYSQGSFAEAAEAEDSRIRGLNNHVAKNPEDRASRLSLARYLIHLAGKTQVAADQRSSYLDSALAHLEQLPESPQALASKAKIAIQRGDAESAEAALQAIEAKDLEARSVTKAEAATLRAEILHLSRRWIELASHLRNSPLAHDTRFAAVRTFFVAA